MLFVAGLLAWEGFFLGVGRTGREEEGERTHGKGVFRVLCKVW